MIMHIFGQVNVVFGQVVLASTHPIGQKGQTILVAPCLSHNSTYM